MGEMLSVPKKGDEVVYTVQVRAKVLSAAGAVATIGFLEQVSIFPATVYNDVPLEKLEPASPADAQQDADYQRRAKNYFGDTSQSVVK
jgi:hypothetical protein